MQVNYQIDDKDFTCATPIFQKFHWGISCCGRTTPGEVKEVVVRTTVWFCTSVVPSLPTAAPARRGERAPPSGTGGGRPILQHFHFPFVVAGTNQASGPVEAAVAWAKTTLVGHFYSQRHPQPGEKAAAVALKPELSWCPSPGELLRREVLRQQRRFQEYTGVSRVETRRSGTTLVSVIKMQSGGKGRSWPGARLSRDTTVRPPTRSVRWKLYWTKAWEIWTQMPIRLALLCSSGAQRSSNRFFFQHQWALKKWELSKLRGHFIHVL